MNELKLIFGGVLFSVAVGVYFVIAGILSENKALATTNAELQGTIEINEAAIRSMAQSFREERQALKDVELRNKQSNASLVLARRKLEGMANDSETIRASMDTIVHADIVDWVREPDDNEASSGKDSTP